MAVSFLNRDVSELCLGKPALRSTVTAATTVREVLTVLKKSGERHVSVWRCEGNDHNCRKSSTCECIGKICMADLICFLCKEDNLVNVSKAFDERILNLLPIKGSGIVKHLDSDSSLLEAIDCIIDGAQNLVIPLKNYSGFNSRRNLLNRASLLSYTLHNGREYCWLTQEDIVRYLLDSINVFSPIPTFTVESMDIINRDIMTVHYHDPASSALAMISQSIVDQTSVAVVDDDNRLVGEISPFSLACCDETVAAAIMTLSAGDLMSYINYGGPPDELAQLIKIRLEENDMGAMLELMEEISISSMSSSSSSSCSSDEEFVLSRNSGSGRNILTRSRNSGGSGRNTAGRRSEAVMCYTYSSLVAVMIQALAHRVSYVWVVEEDQGVVGTVTFEGILRVFSSVAGVRHKPDDEKSFKQ